VPSRGFADQYVRNWNPQNCVALGLVDPEIVFDSWIFGHAREERDPYFFHFQ
jgi:hypothetical protein